MLLGRQGDRSIIDGRRIIRNIATVILSIQKSSWEPVFSIGNVLAQYDCIAFNIKIYRDATAVIISKTFLF
jgi:hypothetical protein